MKRLLAILLAAGLLALCGAGLAEAAVEPGAAEAAPEAALPDPDAVQDAEAVQAAEADPNADAAPGDAFTLWFEEGFGLSVPEGWVSYPVAEEDAAAGVRYALGDGKGENFLYIQAQPTLLEDVGALSERIEADERLSRTGDLVFGGTPFVAFIDEARGVSGCATLWRGELVIFLFTPQSDSAFMMTATELMETFTTVQ